jgi:L-asparaginase II
MLEQIDYSPIFQISRGDIVESTHFGSLVVVDTQGKVLAQYGNPNLVTYLRSTAKPFQALPFIEQGGQVTFNLLPSEVALLCASHSGTDEHVATLLSIQKKTNVLESELLCGTHPPYHEPTAQALAQRGEKPTPNRHNCSGKHTAMLAFAHWQGWSTTDYLDPSHPVQQRILATLSEMCSLPIKDIVIGTDGCSAPNFAIPLYNAAWGYARLCDPSDLPSGRAIVCRTITSAMTSFPEMVAGPDRFDTRLVEAAQGLIVAKGGAEGYQGLGLLPGALGPGSPALGIAVKISDGDLKNRARPAVAIEVLRQLKALSKDEIEEVADFGPKLPVYNWRKLRVGESEPCFELEISPSTPN